MSYVALYRKFRPNDFGEVRGQEDIVTTLKNQLKLGRIGHAYLFTGTRGTGKTTIAKIMAKAVNCENPTENGPCNECPMCKEIQAQSSLNVMEIDAASNNGVDNVREIIDAVQYSPANGKYKVFIIDEVHMLSTAAFNALLKTLEEPPSYVIFIFATTEVHKIPITILSRCQRYDFQRITIDTIASQLRYLVDEENIEADDKALRYIAKAADGSMRDGVSLLDRCIAFCIGEKLTYERVLEVLGAMDTGIFCDLLEAVVNGDVRNALGVIERVTNAGREITWFVNEFIWYLRNLLIVSTVSSDEQMAMMEDMMDMSKDSLEQLKKQADSLVDGNVVRYIRILSELEVSLRHSGQKRILTEVAFIKLCKPEMETDVNSLRERIKSLELQVERIKNISVAAVQNTDSQGGAQPASNTQVYTEVEIQKPILPSALDEDVRTVAKNWTEILEMLSPPTKAVIRTLRLSVVEGDKCSLLLVTTNETMYNISLNSVEEINEAVEKYIKKKVDIAIKHISEAEQDSGMYPDIAKLMKSGVVEML